MVVAVGDEGRAERAGDEGDDKLARAEDDATSIGSGLTKGAASAAGAAAGRIEWREGGGGVGDAAGGPAWYAGKGDDRCC